MEIPIVSRSFHDDPVPYAEPRANVLDPYSIVDPFLDRLVERGLLDQPGEDVALKPLSRDLTTRGERAANDYAARCIRLPPDDLDREQ